MLTFDYQQEPTVQADLVICGPVIEREAKEQNKSLEEHYAHMIVHGTLHAQGWDHETSEEDAEEMEAYETDIMQELATPTPTPKTESCPPAHTSSRHGSFLCPDTCSPCIQASCPTCRTGRPVTRYAKLAF